MITIEEVERLMKRCQIGVGGRRNAIDTANNIMAECYGTLGALLKERNELLRGEYICNKCLLRKDGEAGFDGSFILDNVIAWKPEND